MPEPDDTEEDVYDGYVSAQVLLPSRDGRTLGRVTRRLRDTNGIPIGRSNIFPVLDTRLYEVEFDDGAVAEYSANIIAENIYARTDPNGFYQVEMKSIVDHKKDSSALSLEDAKFTLKGTNHYRKTTKGWKLCVLWKDGSTSWERLSDLKESFPLDVAEYAVESGIDSEPAF